MGFDNPEEDDDPRTMIREADPRLEEDEDLPPEARGTGQGQQEEDQSADQSQSGDQIPAGDASSIGNRIVGATAQPDTPAQAVVADDTTDIPAPDLRVVDVERNQTMNKLGDLVKPDGPLPVLAKQEQSASDAKGQTAPNGGVQTSGTDTGQNGAQRAGSGAEQSAKGAVAIQGDGGAAGQATPTRAQSGAAAKSGERPAAAGKATQSTAPGAGGETKAPAAERKDPFYAYATIAAKTPAEMRGTYLTRLHDVLTQSFLRQGKMVGPDGKVYSAESPRQAEALVQKWVDDAMRDYKDANPYGTRTTPLPPEQKQSWGDKHWILRGLKDSLPEIKRLPQQAVNTLEHQLSFAEHKPGEAKDMLPDPANLLDDKHWILKGLMHTVYDPERNASDAVRAVGRGLDPLAEGLTGGIVDLRHGELHRPGKTLTKLAANGVLPGLGGEIIERLYANTPEHSPQLWDTARGNSIYGKDVDLNADLSGLKSQAGKLGKYVPGKLNVQRMIDAGGKAAGEYVAGEGIGKLVGPALGVGEHAVTKLSELSKMPAKELVNKALRRLAVETVKQAVPEAGKADRKGDGREADEETSGPAKVAGKAAGGTAKEEAPDILRRSGILNKLIPTNALRKIVNEHLEKEAVTPEGAHPLGSILTALLKEANRQRKEDDAARKGAKPSPAVRAK